LLVQGAAVTVVDNFEEFYDPARKWRNIEAHLRHPAYELVQTDIRDLAAMRKTLGGGYAAVIHLAAKAGVRHSIADPPGYRKTNEQGTYNLLELARQWGVPQFIFASSSSVYGTNRNVPWRETDLQLSPASPYAWTKLRGELLGRTYQRLYGIRFIALRFFTVYGPRQRPDLAIHKFAECILTGRPAEIYGDGTATRDYTYVADIVTGILQAIGYTQTGYEIVNLGSGRPISVLEMLAAVEQVLGKKAAVRHLGDQPGDVPRTLSDISKAAELFGYKPAVPFWRGIAQFTDWLRGEDDAPGSRVPRFEEASQRCPLAP
ncbi:MAG: NAD-dependent epimerase/dehydratase family protein, partial [Bryobacteraceae bacterium]